MEKNSVLILIPAAVMTALSVLVMFPLWKPTTPAWWLLKALPTTLSPLMLVLGFLVFWYGIESSSSAAIAMGGWLTAFFALHILLITLPPPAASGFDQAFGRKWTGSASGRKSRYAIKTRFGFGALEPEKPVVHTDLIFYELRTTGRKLLCDVWEPCPEIQRSGLAVVYVHGGAWHVWDKDAGTRKFFRHLTAQGHVVVDVAYRLHPETDMRGMVHDVKHAVAWLKENARAYRVDPRRIVLCGGSAGGHLSLLAAYTEDSDTIFTPADIRDRNNHVAGVISMYGPTDLRDLYYHTGQNVAYDRLKEHPLPPTEMPKWIRSLAGKSYERLGMYKDPNHAFLPDMLGGTPESIPGTYALFSPVRHVHKNCPPTLLVQGSHDLITSARSTRVFYRRLKEAGVPAVMHVLPQVDHAYDLMLPSISLAAHNTYFTVDRFLDVLNVKASSGIPVEAQR